MDVKVLRRDKGAFICSPSPSAYFPLPNPGRAALGLHSPSRRVCTGGRAGGRTHQIFLASWVYQKFLPMVLRWRASRAGAPLLILHYFFFHASFVVEGRLGEASCPQFIFLCRVGVETVCVIYLNETGEI